MIKRVLQRLLDIFLSSLALVVLTPVFTVACVRAALRHKPVLLRHKGRFYFSSLRCCAALPWLFNILCGDMTIDIKIRIKDKGQ